MNLSYRKLDPRQLAMLGMVFPIMLMVVIGWLQWRSVNQYRASRESTKQVRLALLALESFLASLNAVESSQRGYLLTHRESYLQPYTEAGAGIRQEMRVLRELAPLNPGLGASLDRLEPLMNAKLAELAQTVDLEKNMDHAGALKIVLSDFGENTMEAIRRVLGDTHTAERVLLQQREEIYQQKSKFNAEISLLLIGAGCLCIGAIFFMMRQVERMQAMIKICAWSRTVEYRGEWLSIEEYLTRRFHVQITHGMSDAESEKMRKQIDEMRQEMATVSDSSLDE